VGVTEAIARGDILTRIDVGKEAFGGVQSKCKKNGWQIAGTFRDGDVF